ncbi:uncharacterized protein LOC115516183 isoform X2 [Lynx canadensis]|uniref:uncharacterized protein LOC115516183 isoform X2 n=1 Tax=Lynx canadensis TaxID=61383 RepID=UPI0011B0BC9F|nr:uncharacterized protein LOC115516183 isoform X2 [Lynx canadensis]
MHRGKCKTINTFIHEDVATLAYFCRIPLLPSTNSCCVHNGHKEILRFLYRLTKTHFLLHWGLHTQLDFWTPPPAPANVVVLPGPHSLYQVSSQQGNRLSTCGLKNPGLHSAPGDSPFPPEHRQEMASLMVTWAPCCCLSSWTCSWLPLLRPEGTHK